MHNQTVGLTGSSGALGEKIAQRILARADVSLISYSGDLRTDSELQRWIVANQFDTVILSGAIVPVDQASEDPLKTFEVNALSNLKLGLMMQSLYKKKFRICYLSSSHVYLPALHNLTEDSEVKPAGVYGQSKLLGERFLATAADILGFELLIMRVFSFFSKDQKPSHLYPTLLRKLEGHTSPEEPFELTGWNNVRDFSPAEEIAAKVVELSLSDLTGVVNVGSGVATSVGEFASQIYGRPLIFREQDASLVPNRLVADISRYQEWMENQS